VLTQRDNSIIVSPSACGSNNEIQSESNKIVLQLTTPQKVSENKLAENKVR